MKLHLPLSLLCMASALYRGLTFILAASLLVLMPAAIATELTPSATARDVPGAKGRIVFAPADRKAGTKTFWKDTDGVNPGAAGCHIGVTEDGRPNGRFFGEACDSKTGYLIESNPGVNEVHAHENDLGHPDTFDCQAWCVGAMGKKRGMCVAAPGPAPCNSPTGSAKCVCE